MPDATGRFFFSVIVTSGSRPAFALKACAALVMRLSFSLASAPPNGPCNANERFIGRSDRQFVAHVREHDQAFQCMIAIRAALPDMQEQVDLRRREDLHGVRIWMHRSSRI